MQKKGFQAGEPLTGWPEFIAAPGDIWARCKNCISDLRLSALSSASLAELCNLSLSLKQLLVDVLESCNVFCGLRRRFSNMALGLLDHLRGLALHGVFGELLLVFSKLLQF